MIYGLTVDRQTLSCIECNRIFKSKSGKKLHDIRIHKIDLRCMECGAGNGKHYGYCLTLDNRD